MTVIPIPAALDLSDRTTGDEFEVTALVRKTEDGLEVVTIEGETVGESKKPEEGEDEVEVEMNMDAFRKALSREEEA